MSSSSSSCYDKPFISLSKDAKGHKTATSVCQPPTGICHTQHWEDLVSQHCLHFIEQKTDTQIAEQHPLATEKKGIQLYNLDPWSQCWDGHDYFAIHTHTHTHTHTHKYVQTYFALCLKPSWVLYRYIIRASSTKQDSTIFQAGILSVVRIPEYSWS
jgi:hypothetical protein